MMPGTPHPGISGFPPFSEWAKDRFIPSMMDKEDQEDQYNAMMADFSGWKFPVAAYRAVRLHDISELREKEAGACWSWDERGAVVYDDPALKSPDDPKSRTPWLKTFVIKAMVPKDSIDWDATFELGLCGNEAELHLKDGAPVYAVAWSQGDGGWVPLKKTMTAANHDYLEESARRRLKELERGIPGGVGENYRPPKIGSAKPWYHGTKLDKAKEIEKTGLIQPGMESEYEIDIPRKDAVYITTRFDFAKAHAESEHWAHGYAPGIVFEVETPDPSKLVPDEDIVDGCLHRGLDEMENQVQELWLQKWNENAKEYNDPDRFPQYDNFEEAWKAFQGYELGDTSEYSTQMKDLVDYIVEHDPELARQLIERYGIAAHIGPIRVRRQVKTADVKERLYCPNCGSTDVKEGEDCPKCGKDAGSFRPADPKKKLENPAQCPECSRIVEAGTPCKCGYGIVNKTPPAGQCPECQIHTYEECRDLRCDCKVNEPNEGQRPKPQMSDSGEDTPPVRKHVNTPEFKRWFRGSVVKFPDGTPRPVYHGSTQSFEVFDLSKSNIENHYGPGIYFSDNLHDVERNYATETGGDIKARIDYKATKLLEDMREDAYNNNREFPENGPEYFDIWEDCKEKARKECVGAGPAVYLTYLRIERPVEVKKNGGTWFEIHYNEETNKEWGSGVRLYNAVLKVVNDYGRLEGRGAVGRQATANRFRQLWSEITEDGMEFNASTFESSVQHSDVIADMYEENGDELNSGTFIRDVYRKMGFDGIIQRDVDQAWPHMNIPRGTSHYIVWNPRQVKSVLGNEGKFSPWSPKMTASGDRLDPKKTMKTAAGRFRLPGFDEIHYIYYPDTDSYLVVGFKDEHGVFSETTGTKDLRRRYGDRLAGRMVRYEGDVLTDSSEFKRLWVHSVEMTPEDEKWLREMKIGKEKETWEPHIGVDLDGTLAEELVPFDPLKIGKPISTMVEKVKTALEDGICIKVFTARLADEKLRDQIKKIIREWTKEVIGTPLESTNEKTPGTVEIWDRNQALGHCPI